MRNTHFNIYLQYNMLKQKEIKIDKCKYFRKFWLNRVRFFYITFWLFAAHVIQENNFHVEKNNDKIIVF